MKLCTFASKNEAGACRPGLLREGGVLDVTAVMPGFTGSMTDLLRSGPEGLARLKTADGPLVPLDEIRLEAPVPKPGKVMAIGQNYLDHIREMGREPPEHQLWFNKQTTCIVGPGAAIRIPPVSDQVDYEGELVVVIGRRCRRVPAARASDVIAGYMIGNDVSTRDWQRRTPTMTLGKSFDSHGPTGPCLVTADEIPDPHDLAIRTWVNDEIRQDARTSEMIFRIPQQIETLSTVCTLEPGDLIFTGTPAGVGAGMTPPGFLKVGDTVRIEIEGLGRLENPVTADDTACDIA